MDGALSFMSEMLTFHHTFRGAFKRGNEISVHLLITCEPQTFCKLGTFEIPVLEFLSNRYLGIIREKKQEATFSLVICWEESMRTSNQMHKNSKSEVYTLVTPECVCTRTQHPQRYTAFLAPY